MEIRCVKGMYRLKLVSSEKNSGFKLNLCAHRDLVHRVIFVSLCPRYLRLTNCHYHMLSLLWPAINTLIPNVQLTLFPMYFRIVQCT